MNEYNSELESLEKSAFALLTMRKRSKGEYIIGEKSTALLIVDMQNAFCSPRGVLAFPSAREIVPRINLLCKVMRKRHIPIIWLVQRFLPHARNAGLLRDIHSKSRNTDCRKRPLEELTIGSWGSRIWHELNCELARDYIITKSRYSPFTAGSSNLDSLLRSMKISNLIITGVATNVCCEATAKDAMMLDYRVFCVSDAMATNYSLLQRISIVNMIMFYCDIVTTEELLKKVLKKCA